ncbi:glycosyltransferase family 2 protein [Actinomadura macrotermitis]|uniref:Glycosyltransferase 2-like domain-containing protein n=1 Tax=Actinomadura macrotermitis TaxID=2585200 RepID=A0A7K0BQQ8_9ACTN|nr:hypothetical protein [Actinomadura macrotermitis]
MEFIGEREPMTEDGVSVVVVTYRNAVHIEGCAAALRAAAPKVPLELIVVDNDSGDDTAELARKAAPDARVIESGCNGGFAFGCQTGAAEARGKWLLFLNPDAQPLPGSIDALLAQVRDGVGIVGGRCVREDGTDDPRSWWGRPTPWSLLCFALLLSTAFPGSRHFDPESPARWDGVRAVPIVTGAFMLVTREAWERTEGFDTAFFMYGEDADLCLRAAAEGFRSVVTADAAFRHEGGASSSSVRKQVLLFTGKATLVRRHFPRGTRTLGVGLLLLGVFNRALLSRFVRVKSARQGRPTTEGDAWRGLWQARKEWRSGW